MAVEMTTVARPYAKAIYRLAKQKDQVEQWGQWLAALKQLLSQSDFVKTLLHPDVSQAQRIDALMRWVQADSGSLKRLLTLLAERGRLQALPAISQQFQVLVAEQVGRVDVQVSSAFALSENLQNHVVDWLAKQWGANEVQADFIVDDALIGGIEISTQDGDRVLRLSVRHQLQQLKQALLRA